MKPILPFLALALAAAPSTAAPGAPTPAARGALFRSLPPLLQQGLGAGMRREAFEDRIGAMFRYLDADRDGRLTPADAEAYDRGRVASLRAKAVAALVAFDVDGDGRVTKAEVVAGLRRGLPLPPGLTTMDTPEATALSVMWAYDANRDGSVDYDEMRSAPLPDLGANPVEALLALAPRGAESLDEREARSAAATAVFDLLDADGDGLVDDGEYAAASAR